MREKNSLRNSTVIWSITIGILIINLIFKLFNLNNLGMYGDESFTLFFSQQTISEIMDRIKTDSNPFLHPVLLHYFIKLFGVTVFNGKLFSVIMSSVAGSLLFYLFAKRKQAEMGLAVAGIFLMCGLQLFYAHEIRAFAQVVLLTVLSVHFFLRLTENPKIRHLLFLGIVNLALLLSHYATFLLPLMELMVAFLYFKNQKKTFQYFFYSQAIAALLFLPWFYFTIMNHIPTAGKSWVPVPTIGSTKSIVVELGEKILLVINIGVIFLWSINRFIKILKPGFNHIWFLFFNSIFWGSIILNYTISHWTPIMLSRYLLFSTIGLYLAIGYYISNVNIKDIYRYVAYGFIYICMFFIFYSPPVDTNWPKKIELIQEHKTENTVIFIHAWWQFRPFSYYYNPDYFLDYKTTIQHLQRENIHAVNAPENTITILGEKRPNNIILVNLQGTPHTYFIDTLLSIGYKKEWQDWTEQPNVTKLIYNNSPQNQESDAGSTNH